MPTPYRPTDIGEAALDAYAPRCPDCNHRDVHCIASGCNAEGCECERGVMTREQMQVAK